MRFRYQALIAVLAYAAQAQPQTATKADSGWISLFNEVDFSGLYVFESGKGRVDAKAQTDFTVESGIIKVKGSPGGFLGTIRQYSHYRARVEYQWPAGTPGNANSGLLIHLDSAAIFSGAYTSGGRPRSIEVNCRRDNNYPWSLWSANRLGPYITSTVTSIPAAGVQGQYKPAGIAWTNNPWGDNNRIVSGDLQANPESAIGQWNRGEAHLFGDSGVFILNGQVRTRGWNFRNRVQPADATPTVACTKGNIGLQSEGAPISFRNFEIQELDPATGIPLHARRGCTDRGSTRYDPRAVEENGSCAASTALTGSGSRRAGTLRFRARDMDKALAAFPDRSSRTQWFDMAGRAEGQAGSEKQTR